MHLSSNPTPCKPPLLDDHPGRRPWPTRCRLLHSSSSWSSADLPDPSHPRLAVVQCAGRRPLSQLPRSASAPPARGSSSSCA
ncbi:hypothetical protein M6B38_285960 [Iris pallida]|uniref:Uncharacterized protein n=1 Tax=Iris pallida TaxID=29817 RepID=A0AAX6HYQ2_IRIPA|nr:hypothetical protein M6B38_285960 [Iris pallida]